MLLVKFKSALKRFRKDVLGVTLIEYGIAVTLAVTVGTATSVALASDITSNLNKAGTEMSSN